MAVWYVYHGGDDDPGYGPTDRTDPTQADNWSNAFTDLDSALDAVAAGDTIYVAHDHEYAYTANVVYTSPGTLASPVKVICVNRVTGAYATTAIEDADGSTYDITLGTGLCNIYGVTFKIGDDLNTTSGDVQWVFVDCDIQLNRSGGGVININAGVSIVLINSTLTLADSGNYVQFSSYGSCFIWYGGSLSGDPDILIQDEALRGSTVEIRGVDLSSMVGGSLCEGAGTIGEYPPHVLIEGCKLNATAPSLVSGNPVIPKAFYKMIGCHSGNVPYFQENYTEGNIYHDSSVYRSGADPSSNNFSAEIVTTGNASYHNPLRYKLAELWCSANPTLKVHCTHDVNGDSSDLQNDEFWLEIEYPTSSNAAYRQWNRSSKCGVLSSPSDLTTEGSAGWTSSQNVDNSISVTISGGAAGVHTVWACLARASETVYVCPQIDVS